MDVSNLGTAAAPLRSRGDDGERLKLEDELRNRARQQEALAQLASAP